VNRPEQLLARLDEIGRSLERTGSALALIGLGSVGADVARLDAYSDLDFFVISAAGFKRFLIDDLHWLAAVHPIVYFFQNTADGHKALFADGVYCEFAVFEAAELERIPFAQGRVIWSSPGFDRSLARPRRGAGPTGDRPTEWLLGEALTCLYVGLGRFRRGEKLSAFRFVQVFVVDRLVELAPLLEEATPENGAVPTRDEFAPERRFELRFPRTAAALAPLMQGYERTPESARAILALLDGRFDVNQAMKAAILALCGDG
jgi:hypothetical protein